MANIFDTVLAVLSKEVLDTDVLNDYETDPQSGVGRVTQCQAKRNEFPSATIIEKYYPKPYNKTPPNCQDANPDGTWKWGNQCAIRMSIALSGAGVSLKGYTDPKCSHGHARGARSLANWIWRMKLLCPPEQYTGPDALTIKDKIKDRDGLIYFHNLDGEEGNDHIDLYRNNNTQATYSNLWTAVEYWFFELNT